MMCLYEVEKDERQSLLGFDGVECRRWPNLGNDGEIDAR